MPSFAPVTVGSHTVHFAQTPLDDYILCSEGYTHGCIEQMHHPDSKFRCWRVTFVADRALVNHRYQRNEYEFTDLQAAVDFVKQRLVELYDNSPLRPLHDAGVLGG